MSSSTPRAPRPAAAACAALLWLAACGLIAQEPPEAGGAAAPAGLKFGLEWRQRGEAASAAGLETGHRHLASLSRLRLSADAAPASWLRFHLQVQDARALAGADSDLDSAGRNTADLRYGWAEFGSGEGSGPGVRLGRQPLTFGDGRLIGSDETWDYRGLAFDGFRATLPALGGRLDVFAAAPVAAAARRPDPFGFEERLAGLYGRWQAAGGRLSLEPYLFWTRRPGSNLRTPGARIAAELPLRLTATVEAALQHGRADGLAASAWAVAARVERRLGADPASPRVSAGYSAASGDRDPSDRRRRTFDDLYAAGFNGSGHLDPFAWRNLHDLSWGAEWSPRRRWKLAAEIHHYWLLTTRDGLYVDGGEPFLFSPGAPSSRAGAQSNALAQYRLSRRFELAFGYARFFAGPYLQGSAPSGHSGFLAWTLTL